MTEKVTNHPPQHGSWFDDQTGATGATDFGGNGYDALVISHSGRHGPFYSDHVKYGGGGMSGNDGHWNFSNWPCQWCYENWNPIKSNPGNDVPSWAWLSTKLFAQSRPDSTQFDISRAIGELRDVPRMIKQAGDSMFKHGVPYTIGSLNLQYSFGWKPLFEDCVRMSWLQEMIAKRFKQLKRMQESGSVIRKVRLYSGSQTGGFDSAPMDYWLMSARSLVLDNIWGYTIWKTTNQYPSTDEALMAMARDTTLGFSTNHGQTAWNLIPWTWLSDWFVNVSDFLAACSNTDDIACSAAQICHERVHTANAHSVGDRYSHHYGSVEPLTFSRIERRRGAADPPSIATYIPVLRPSDIGILGSIAATKRRN